MKQRLSEAIDDYLKHRKSKRIAATTMVNDRTTLTALCRTVPSNLFVENITSAHMDTLFEELAQTRSDRSLNNDFYVLTAFFKWCADSKRIPRWHDPLASHSAPAWTHRDRNRLPVTKFAMFLDAAPNPRDRVLFALALYTLGRANEIVRITVGDVDFDNQKLRMPLSKNRKKGGKSHDWMPITRELRDELARWYLHYQEQCGPLKPEWYLVPAYSRPKVHTHGGHGRAMFSTATQELNPVRPFNPKYSTTASDTLERIGFPVRDAEGNPTGEGMHTLRRSGARAHFDALRAAGYDGALRRVQALLHHRYSSMTEHYIGITLDILERDEALMGEYMYPQVAPQQDVIPIVPAGHMSGDDDKPWIPIPSTAEIHASQERQWARDAWLREQEAEDAAAV